MRESYLAPIIEYRLKREFANERIFRNPRITEVNDITIDLAKETGTVFMYEPGSILYEEKLRKMVEYYIDNPTYMEVDKYGGIKINLPEYMSFDNDYNKQEHVRYESEGAGRISRTKFRVEKGVDIGQKTMNEHSLYDENGIEMQKELTIVSKMEETRKKYIRVEGKPHIIQETDLATGEIRFLNMVDSEHFEDLDIEHAKEIKESEIKDLTPVEKIRISERTSRSVYGEGIKKLLGMQVNMGQRNSDTGR